MHSGNVGLSQNLETLVDAAALLRDVPDLVVAVVGDGVKRAALEFDRPRGVHAYFELLQEVASDGRRRD